MRLAARMDDLGTETAFEAAGKARALEAEGRHIVHLHLGEPDFDTPANISAAATAALDAGLTHYGPPLGVGELREAIAADTGSRRGVTVEPASVVVTPGAKPVMAFAMMALVEAGDEVIVPDPGFPIYDSMARFMGATSVPLPLRQAADFRPDLDELQSLITPRTRMLVINSPNNPNGGVFTAGDIATIAELAAEHDLVVLADEIYDRIVHDGEHHSLLSLDGMAERTILLNGFSKTYAMTGWRLGYGILPAALVPAFERLMINTVSCTATYPQLAAVEALTGPQDSVDVMVAELAARRTLIVEGLEALPGVTTAMPRGAFYAFPDISGTGYDGATLAGRLLDEAGVSVIAGTAFGGHATHNIRVSYANSPANLRLALERIGAFLEANPGRAGT